MTIQELPMPQTSTGGCGCGAHAEQDPTIDATAIPTGCVTPPCLVPRNP